MYPDNCSHLVRKFHEGGRKTYILVGIGGGDINKPRLQEPGVLLVTSTLLGFKVLTYSRRIDRRPKRNDFIRYKLCTPIMHSTYHFPHCLARVFLLCQPLHLQPPRKVPGIAEEERPSIQVRLDQRKQVCFDWMRRVLNGNIWVEWHDLELVRIEDVVRGYSTKPLAVGDKNEVFRCQFIWGKSEVPHGRHAFQGHAHMVRVINPTIPWIALPNRIAPFGGGVPGAACDGCEQTKSMVNVPRRTVDHDITRGPVYRQRRRIGGFGWKEGIGFIVDVPRIKKSEKWARIEAERRVQVEMPE